MADRRTGGLRARRGGHNGPVEVRPARPDDALAVARVHVRSWQSGYRGSCPTTCSTACAPRTGPSGTGSTAPDPADPVTLVAEQGGVIQGFVTVSADPEPDRADTGEVCALYVDPPAWRRGVGRTLMAAARDALVTRGCTRAGLWVLVGNEAAERFYRGDGWRSDGERRQAVVWGLTVDEARLDRQLR